MRTPRIAFRAGFCCAIFMVVLMLAADASAGTLSIGPTPGHPFPTATGHFDDDLLATGPAATLQVAGAGVSGVDVNAISFGRSGVSSLTDILGVEFSVALGSFGVAGTALAAQVAALESGADIFFSSGGGTNSLVHDGDALGPGPIAPPVGVVEPTTPPPAGFRPDEVDGWDRRLAPPLGSPVYFSLEAATGSSDAVFTSALAAGYDAVGVVYASHIALGLGVFPGTNDIDGLVVIDNDGAPGTFTPGVDLVFFSLSVGDVTLAPAGATAGDILVDPAGAALLGIAAPPGLPGVVFTEASLGISTALSDLDAFDFHVVPEPASWVLAWVACAALLAATRRRRELR